MFGSGDSEWRGGSRWSRVFGGGENPLWWSVPLYRAWGIAVRAHVILVAIVLVRIIRTISEDSTGLPLVALGLSGLLVLVLLHEYGHALTCRKLGGEADEILLWPLGGLAMCRPPETWQAHLWTVIGGPAVNLVLLPVLGGALLAAGGSWESVLFNPFAAGDASQAAAAEGPVVWSLWALHAINAMLLGFNVLVPMYPLDGGRILHAFIWRSRGRFQADKIVTGVGLVAAVVLGLVGLWFRELILVGIAAFGGFACWAEQRRLRFVEEPFADWPMPEPGSALDEPDDDDSEEIDVILEKISRGGMASLTRRERKKLEKATAARRDG